ncbi:MAG: ribulose-phosphate 3-epimerase [Bdellovibrionota bacterium]
MTATNTFLIAPSILSADFAKLGEEIKAVEAAGADWIHVDVMDGHFVPNITIGAPVVKSLRAVTKLPLDCHLMIENPEKYVEDFAKAGADYITIHIEATTDPKALIEKIRKLGSRPGITLRPATSIDKIIPYLGLVDLVLIMTVNPGFSGQSFMREQIAKISEVKKELTRIGSKALIEVDGGINPETAKEVTEADVLVAGNAVFKAGEYRAAITSLKAAKTAAKSKGTTP